MKLVKNLLKNILAFVKKIFIKLLRKDKIKLYLYYQNRFIKKIYVKEDIKPMGEIYVIRVFFKKFVLGSWNTKVVVEPIGLKYSNAAKKELHIETKMFGGV
jgi:hypothetical protein